MRALHIESFQSVSLLGARAGSRRFGISLSASTNLALGVMVMVYVGNHMMIT